MSMQTGIFNSTQASLTPEGFVHGNKAVDAAFVARIFSGLFKDGIFGGAESSGFYSTAVGGSGGLTSMKVRTTGGACHIAGYFAFEDDETEYTVPVSTSAMIHCYIIRLDTTAGTITASWKPCVMNGGVLKSQGKVVPRHGEDGVYELVTARIDVPAGCVDLLQEHITDLRADPAFCGFAAARM